MALFGFGKQPKTFSFKCSECDEIHQGSPSFSYKRPGHYLILTEENRKKFARANDDLCEILPTDDGQVTQAAYYIRCTLDIPIHGAADPFLWGLWVSQSKESFWRYYDTFDDDQEGDGSFGWLDVPIPYYADKAQSSDSLEVDTLWGSQRPKVILHESEHPLYIDQQNGISWDTAIKIATRQTHGS